MLNKIKTQTPQSPIQKKPSVRANEDVDRFDREGYLLIKNVFDAATIAGLRKLFLAALQRENSRLLVDAVVKYPAMREALDNPRLLDALRALLGTPFVALPVSSVDHNRFGQFHKDTTGTEMDGRTFHKDKDYRIIVVAIYLQDNNEYGGGLTLVPGTHTQDDPYVALLNRKHAIREKTNRSLVRRTLKKLSRGRLFSWQAPLLTEVPGAIDVPTKAGDVLIWDMRIVHRATPQKIKGEALPGGKLALFFELGVNNNPTRQRIEHLQETTAPEHRRPSGTVLPTPTNDIIFT